MYETELADKDFKDVRLLAIWVHGPGSIHTARPVEKMDDMTGLKLRGPTRIVNELLVKMGAVPIGMPVSAVPESPSKGVIDGAVVPWEVTPAIRLAEMVRNHTEFGDGEALYAATFVVAMNKARYDSLPDDLKRIIDDHSGAKLSAFAAQAMLDADAPARAAAIEAGNKVIVLGKAEVDRWKEVAKPIVADWVKQMNEKGIDGEAVIETTRALIAKHAGTQ